MEAIVTVQNLRKNFRLPSERHNSLKQTVLNLHKRSFKDLEVLKGISFEVKAGEFFGIIGRNGSGKSTLLKVLAGIYASTSGSSTIKGSLTPFIELGVGFNPELSGRDNVYLNGAILGLTRQQIQERYNDIVAFAELEKFMDQKIKNYSSGMQVRLAFSVAIQAHSDILLIDEVLAVGDLSFQNKCYKYFHNLKKLKKTVILVTHDMGVINEFCDRGIVIHNGKIKAEGEPGKIMRIYQDLNKDTQEKATPAGLAQVGKAYKGEASITRFQTLDSKDVKTSSYKPGEKIRIEVVFKAYQDLDKPVAGIAIMNADGQVVFAANQNLEVVARGTSYRVVFEVDNIFTDGTYRVSTAIDNQQTKTSYARYDFGCSFKTSGWENKHSQVHPPFRAVVHELKDGHV